MRLADAFRTTNPPVDLTESISTTVVLTSSVLASFDQYRTPKSVLNSGDEIFVRISSVDNSPRVKYNTRYNTRCRNRARPCFREIPRRFAHRFTTIIRTYIIISCSRPAIRGLAPHSSCRRFRWETIGRVHLRDRQQEWRRRRRTGGKET